LDIVVGEGAAVFELLAREDETLLVWRYALFVLDLGLYIVDRVAGLYLEGDSLAREGLNKAVEGMSVLSFVINRGRGGYKGAGSYICTVINVSLWRLETFFGKVQHTVWGSS
jgi:hypothetical protein